MPSLKSLKSKFSPKSKKSKTVELPKKMPPNPVMSQTPPVTKKMMKTAPPNLEVRTSAPAAMGGGTAMSASMKSVRSSKSPHSSRLQIDDHKQLKEVGRPEEPPNSSDPDTSLYEYEDDRELVTTLRKTISFQEVRNSDRDDEEREGLEFTARLPGDSTANSARNSLNTSLRMRADRDSELRDSTDKVETELHKTVCGLEELTATKPPDGDEKQQLQYYHKLEDTTEKTLRGQEELIVALREEIRNLEGTVTELKKYKDLTEQEMREVSGTLEADNKNLKSLVYKVKQEMSHCQAHHQLVKDPNGNRVTGLPSDAPTPAWMINFKYLSPLIKSLEDQVAMKSQELASLKRKFAKYEADIRSLTAENENLRQAMKAGGSDPEAIGKKAWNQLQKQALLVVEENEVLLKKLDIQEEKLSQLHEKQYYEFSQLEDKAKKVEVERQIVSEKLTDTKCQLELYKSKCEQLSASLALKVDREEHNRALMEYRAKLERAKEDQERDKESFLLKLSQVEFEREECEERQSELKDELREAKHEIKNKVKCIVSLEEDCAALTREVKQGKDVVAKLLLVTDEAVHERQSMKHFLKSEKTNKKKSVGAIVESELMKEKVVESFKKYKVKAEKEIDKLLAKLEKQAEEFDVERREYERQLKHLRLLVHEKDVQKQEAIRDKQDVDECLELVWKATQADNNDLNNSLRKSMRESRLKHLGNFWMNSSKTDVVRQAGHE